MPRDAEIECGRRSVASQRAGKDDAVVGQEQYVVCYVVDAEVGREPSRVAERAVDRAVRVEAREEVIVVRRRSGASNKDLAIRLQGEAVRAAPAVEHRHHPAIRVERRIGRAVGVVARQAYSVRHRESGYSDPAVVLHDDSAPDVIATHVGRHLPVGVECCVRRTIRVVARQSEIRAADRAARARQQDASVGINDDVLGQSPLPPKSVVTLPSVSNVVSGEPSLL